jgi:anti-sigma factor (TIGR02949 family)
MSIPDFSKMKHDCPNQQECLQRLQLIVDGEATEEDKQHFIKFHLEECLPCYKNYQLELAIRQLLKSKCSGEAPQELIESIKSRVIQNLAK